MLLVADHAHVQATVERHCDVAVVGGSAAGLAAALLLARQQRAVIVVDTGRPGGAAARTRGELRSCGGEILAGRVAAVRRAGAGLRLELVGGHAVVARRALVAVGSVDDLAEVEGLAEASQPLGLRTARHPGGRGDAVETDDTGATSVPGLYAAGGVADPALEAPEAAAHGARVGSAIGSDLASEDRVDAARPPANQEDWDHRYSGEQLWSGRPNGSLVNHVEAMPPGRALDVGAGEGGDALWLAARGWDVTASDISQRALDRLAAEARRRGLRVECRRVDANAPGAFAAGGFDLVSAHYASIPRTPDDRGILNLVGAVAPGGTLLVVGHDLEPLRAPLDTRSQSQAFDPDAYVRTDDVAAALAATSGWEIIVHERQPRPPGAASASHHVDDVVLRARRPPS